MKIRRPAPLIASAVLALGIAACGGGGGGSSPAPPPPTTAPTTTPTSTPTTTPTTTPTASALACTAAGASQTNCTYTVTSNPSGIQVTLNGASIGQTPLTFTPPFTAAPQTLAFANSSYTVTINQTGNAARVVYYNAVSDTGSVSLVGNQSKARRAASVSTDTLRSRGLSQFSHAPAIATSGIYVKYDASKLTRRIDQMESDAGAAGGADVLSSVAAIRGRIVNVRAGDDVRDVAGRLANQPGVIGVYPLHYRVALGTPATVTRMTTNDADFGYNEYQWDLDAIQATYAWTIAPSLGADAKIAIIDTGVDLMHPDMPAGKIIYQASAINGVLTANSSQPSLSAQDTNSHGTNVAGIAAANGNDTIGFVGVAYKAKILAYRIFPNATTTSDEQSANTGDEVLAINDAVKQGADVINLSLGSAQFDPIGGSGFDQAEHDAIEAALSAGVTVVAASGNGDANNNAQPTIDFPAAYDGVIAVGASAISDNNAGTWNPSTGVFTGTTEVVASYSNYGPGLGVVAPGGDTGTAGNSSGTDSLHWIENDSSTTAANSLDQCTVVSLPRVCGLKYQGTSQATPHVTGTVALIQSELRNMGQAVLAPAQMLQLIDGTADNINSPYQGHGRLNTLRAVAGALGLTVVGAPAVPKSSPSQFVAFAYINSGSPSGKPAIVDQTYQNGVPVASDGSFRIADVDPTKTSAPFKIAVWLDANGDGIVDAGDQFGASTVTCTANAPCHPGTIAVTPVTANTLVLP